MKLNNLKIGQRLSLGFGAVLALVVAIVAVSYIRFLSSEREQVAAAEYGRRDSVVSAWMSKTELNIARAVAIAKSGGQPSTEAYFGPLMKETSAEISALQKNLEASISSDKGKALLATVGDKRKVYIALRSQMGELQTKSDHVAAEALMGDQVLPAAKAYLTSMEALRQFQHEIALEHQSGVAEELSKARVLLLGLLAASLAVGVLMAWAITRSVTQPVDEAVAAAKLIAASDLSQTMHSERRDELGDLLRSLGEMQSSLRKLVGEVRATTDGIHTASSEISSGNHDLSVRTEQAASSLQQTASSMEQMTATVRQSADSARQANQLVASAAEVAQRGGTVVSHVVATMDEINASSKKIADIIGVIDGIAFQTNILALNAAVEAARAGEQGRGFAVVASEVRSLAQRSSEAAKEIKGLIGASVDKVEDGSKLVADAGQTMQEIVGAVQRVSDIIGEITAASVEQSDGIGQVNTAVSQLDRMTQQNAALVEESAAAAESLKDQAQRLASVVQVFRLDAQSTVTAQASAPAATVAKVAMAQSAKSTQAVKSSAPVHRRPARRAAAPPEAAVNRPPARLIATKAAGHQPSAVTASAAARDSDWETF